MFGLWHHFSEATSPLVIPLIAGTAFGIFFLIIARDE